MHIKKTSKITFTIEKKQQQQQKQQITTTKRQNKNTK